MTNQDTSAHDGPPFSYFNVVRRNSGRERHWDIGDGKQRAFRIRGGEDGKPFAVVGEGKYNEATGSKWLEFYSLSCAMAWIADYFMQEPPIENNAREGL